MKNRKKRLADVLQAVGLGAYAVAFFKSETGTGGRIFFGVLGTACIVASVLLTEEDDPKEGPK